MGAYFYGGENFRVDRFVDMTDHAGTGLSRVVVTSPCEVQTSRDKRFGEDREERDGRYWRQGVAPFVKISYVRLRRGLVRRADTELARQGTAEAGARL